MELNFDQYIDAYMEQGFKLVKDLQEGDSRSATLRLYTADEYGEVMLREKNGTKKVSIMQSMNGKVVFTQ